MPRFLIMDLRCEGCDFEKEVLLEGEKAKVGSSVEDEVCPHCGGDLYVKFPAPAIRTSESASFLDGTVRGDIVAAKADLALRSARMSTKGTERADISKEIKERKGK